MAAASFAAGGGAMAGGPGGGAGDRVIETAANLMGEGKVVHARAVLAELSTTRGLALTDAQRTRAGELLAAAERRLGAMTRDEAALQRADLLLSTGDLAGAQRAVDSVNKDGPAGVAAGEMGTRVQLARDLAAKAAPGWADQAVSLYESGDTTGSRALVERVSKSGVTLDASRQSALDAVRSALVERELSGGSVPSAMSAFAAPDDVAWLLGSTAEDVAFEAQPVVENLGTQAPNGSAPQIQIGGVTVSDDAFTPEAFDPFTPSTMTLASHSGAAQPIVEPLPPTQPLTPQSGGGSDSSTPARVTPTSGTTTSGGGMNPFITAAPAQPVVVPSSGTISGSGSGSPDLIEAARRFEAKSLLGEANVAFEERRLNEALDKYSRILNEFSSYLDAADLDIARQRRAEVQVQLNAQGGPTGTGVGDVLGGTLSDRELERQRVEATFRNLMQQARAGLDSADTNAARDLVAQARLEVNRGRDVLSEATYQARVDEIETLIGRINVREEQLRIEEGLGQARRVEDEARQAESDRLARLNTQINDALSRVRTLQAEMKYDEALQVVEQILFLDPTNPAGLLLRDVLQDTLIWRDYSESKRVQATNIGRHLAENHEAAIPPLGLMEYPADWPAITLRRGQPLEFAESPANRPVMAALRGQTLPVNFAETPLIDAIGFIQANTGVNIDVDWTALEDIGVDQEAPVTLRLSDVSVETLLDRVLSKVSDRDLPAEWAVLDGVLVVSSGDVIRQNTTLEIYDIRDLLFEVPDFEDAPHIDLSQQNQQSGRGGGGGGQGIFGGAGGGGGGQFDPADRDTRVTAILDAIRNNIDPDGWIDLGGETGAIQELNGNLIITQTPRAHAQIVTLLNKLRETRQLQINVEARFLTVAQDFFEQIGFDLDVYLNADNNAATITTLLDPTSNVGDLFGGNGELLPVFTSNIAADPDGDGTAALFPVPVLNPRAAGEEWSVIRGAQNSFGIANSLGSAASGFASTILAENPALGITGRFLDDIQVDFIINATQADQRSVTLTAPRLTFTNGQRAWVAVTTQQSYISDLQPVVADSATAFDPVIGTADEGVTLEVIGVVSADRRYVTLTMLTEVAELSFATERDFSGGAGGGGVGGGGGANSTATLQFPILDRSAVRTTVTIPDQGTALLGGQRVVTEVEVESGVPVLSKIPILSRFFSNRIETTEDRTLLILVKPTILIQEENEETAFPGLLDQAGL